MVKREVDGATSQKLQSAGTPFGRTSGEWIRAITRPSGVFQITSKLQTEHLKDYDAQIIFELRHPPFPTALSSIVQSLFSFFPM